MEKIVLFVDGSCKGNPGPMGVGYVLAQPDGRTVRVLRQGGTALEHGTNNVAEFQAVVIGIEWAEQVCSNDGLPLPSMILTDSELVQKTLTDAWVLQAEHLLDVADRCREALARIGAEVVWIPGSRQIADAQANAACCIAVRENLPEFVKGIPDQRRRRR